MYQRSFPSVVPYMILQSNKAEQDTTHLDAGDMPCFFASATTDAIVYNTIEPQDTLT